MFTQLLQCTVMNYYLERIFHEKNVCFPNNRTLKSCTMQYCCLVYDCLFILSFSLIINRVCVPGDTLRHKSPPQYTTDSTNRLCISFKMHCLNFKLTFSFKKCFLYFCLRYIFNVSMVASRAVQNGQGKCSKRSDNTALYSFLAFRIVNSGWELFSQHI